MLKNFTQCKIYFNSMGVSGGQARGQLPLGTVCSCAHPVSLSGRRLDYRRFQLPSTSGYLPPTIGQVLEPAEEPG